MHVVGLQKLNDHTLFGDESKVPQKNAIIVVADSYEPVAQHLGQVSGTLRSWNFPRREFLL